MKVLICALAVVGLMFGPMQEAAAKKTFRLTVQLPLKSDLGQNALMFKQEVEKATGGEIEIQIYDSAQLYQDKDVPQAVASGAIEMGVSSLTRFAGSIPAVDVFFVPFLLDGEGKVAKAIAPDSPVRMPLDAAILKTGARVLWWQDYGSTVLVSKKAPIKTPADLKGKKVRVFGKTLGTWVQAVGGAPVNVAGSEQFLAYQRGTVDVGMTGPTTIKSRKIWEVMEHITLANVASVQFMVIINDKAFQSLTPAQQKIFIDAARRAEQDLLSQRSVLEREAIEAGKQNKMGVYVPTPAELAEWRKSVAPVTEAFLKGAGPLGKQVYEAASNLK